MYHTLDTQKSMKPLFGHPVSKYRLRPWRTLNNVSCPGTLPLKINGRLPGYIEHLSTLNIEHQICSRRPVYFEHSALIWNFSLEMRTNELHNINCFVKWYFSNAEHVKFLTIWRKWGKDIVDFAMKWSCFSNYPWFFLYFIRPPITQNLNTLNTCVHWTLFHFPWVFNVDRFHCRWNRQNNAQKPWTQTS